MSKGRDTRFRPGQSGNPRGRPLKHGSESPLYSLTFGQKQVVRQNGVEREMSVEEALQLRMVQAALKGDSSAFKVVSGWLVEREAWRSSGRRKKKSQPECVLVRERDSDNAFEAMCLLGIAVKKHDPREPKPDEPTDYSWISLLPWATLAALQRVPDLNFDSELMGRMRMHTLLSDRLDAP